MTSYIDITICGDQVSGAQTQNDSFATKTQNDSESDCAKLTARDTTVNTMPIVVDLAHDDDINYADVETSANNEDDADHASHRDCGSHCDHESDDDDDCIEFNVEVKVSDENKLISSIIPEEFDTGFNTAIYTSSGREIPCHTGKVFTKIHMKDGTVSIVFVQALLTKFDENIVTYYVDSDELQKWRESNTIGKYLCALFVLKTKKHLRNFMESTRSIYFQMVFARIVAYAYNVLA